MSTQSVRQMVARPTHKAMAAPVDRVAYTVREAAEALGVSETTAWRLVNRRVLASIKVGKSRRVLVSAIHEYVERLAAESDVA